MDDYESLSHSKWECKYHVVFIPKCRRKTLYGEFEAASRGGIPQIGNAEGVQGRRGAFDARSCSHDDFDPTQICGVASDRVHQRKERNPPGPCLWRTKAQLRRAAFLGQGILRLDRRSRRSGDQGVHPQAGSRGYSARPTEYVALRPPSGGQQNRGRVSVPTAALSGPIPKAPGFAGGYLPYPMRGEVTNRVLLGRKRHGCPGIQSGCQRWERPGWQQTRRLEDYRMTAAAKSTPVLKSLNGFWWNSRPRGTGGRPM